MEAWRRTQRAVWLANLVTAAGMMSFLPFFPSHLQALGLEGRAEIATWAGILYGAAPLSAAVMSPIWGAIGDRVGRKPMVLRSMLAIALFVGAMAFATSPWQLLILRLLQGAFSGFVAPSLTLVSVAAPAERQGAISASLQQAMTLGAVIGPALGEFARAHGGIRAAYLTVAALALCSAVCVALFAEEHAGHRRAHDGDGDWFGALRASFGDLSELRANRALRAAIVLTFWLQFGMGATTPMLEILVQDFPAGEPHWLPLSTGALFSAVAIANLLFLPWWGKYGDRRGHSRALLACSLLSGLVLLIHAAPLSFDGLVGARFALGAAMAGSGPLAFGVAAAESSTHGRGGAFGVVFAARCLAVAVAAILGGLGFAALGGRGLFIVSGALVLVSVAWYAPRARSSDAAAAG
ncbi:MAG: MFS transporter [Planctomycetes bacterium]|nr:MFS transporter [Planctomycetota bacterium]